MQFSGEVENDVSINDLALKAINNVIVMESLIFDLKSAVHMFHLANNLCKFCDTDIDAYANIGKITFFFFFCQIIV